MHHPFTLVNNYWMPTCARHCTRCCCRTESQENNDWLSIVNFYNLLFPFIFIIIHWKFHKLTQETKTLRFKKIPLKCMYMFMCRQWKKGDCDAQERRVPREGRGEKERNRRCVTGKQKGRWRQEGSGGQWEMGKEQVKWHVYI